MSEPDFTKDLFDRLADIINDAKQSLKEGKIVSEIPDDVEARIQAVRALVDAYKEGVNILIESSGVTADQMRDEVLKNAGKLPNPDQRRLKRAALMSMEVGAIRDALKHRMEQPQEDSKKDKSPKKRSKKHHEGDIGFGQGWTRL